MIKLKISENDQVSKITNGRNGKSLVVTFKSSNYPLDILGHKISPALKSLFRCNNCQGFGHPKSVCYSNLKCPHCAENHTHNECKSDLKKFANCFGQHSAAYKGCPEYISSNKIKKLNCKTIDNHVKKCKTAGIKPENSLPFPKPVKKVNNNELKEISKSLVGKNESEIYEILRAKIFVNNDQIQNIEFKKKKNAQLPRIQRKKGLNLNIKFSDPLLRVTERTGDHHNCVSIEHRDTPPPPPGRMPMSGNIIPDILKDHLV